MYTISEITTLLGAHRVGNAPTHVEWLLTDSRSLLFPDETMFFAIKTSKNDGHRYIDELYQRGVRSFVVADLPAEPQPDANYLQVPSPQRALQRLAERHREAFDIPIIGITGSNGKTIVKEWLYQMLAPDLNITRSPRSWNSQIGVPLSVWRLNENSQLGIFETGISEPGEMDALAHIIQPTIGILTTIGSAHDENFGSREEKCMEKLRLFRHAQYLIYHADNEVADECIQRSKFDGKLIAWHEADIPDTLLQAIPFIDAASREDAIHCIVTCRLLGLDDAVIAQRLARLEAVSMRLEVFEGQRGCTLISDSFNNDLGSLEIALDFMHRRSDDTTRRRLLILSDIKQTGLTLTELYRRVNDLILSHGIDDFVGIGPEISAGMSYIGGSNDTRHFFDTTDDFLHSPLFHGIADRVVLIKGARLFRFDRITEALVEKVHETILEVNLSAVVDNLNHYRAMMRPQTKVICMVKASAYGAGAVEIAKTLQDHHVDYLAVAVADEGVELRKAGIHTGIIVMNPEMSALHTLFEYNLEPEVYSFRWLDALIHAAEHEGITSYPVHIKLDTGMHRLGFDPFHDMLPLVQRLQSQKALLPRSVFSHFVGADSADFDDFSLLQWQRFCQGADFLQSAFPHHILRHICNSAGIERFADRHLDMVRLGLGLYGIDPLTGQMLSPISTLRTTILQIHDIPADETVGYSRRGQLDRPSRIAALPIGYADGLDRHLGCGRGYCLVGGKRAPYVGNICMDVCMIDVTDIPCQEGDTAIIFGPDLPPTVLAQAIDTIPYEVLTSVSPRVKRKYYLE